MLGNNTRYKMVLGVDVSTSITGFAIVADGEIVFYD